MILYHATYQEHLASIQQDGLIRGCPKNFEGMYTDDAVFLAFYPEAAISYIESADTYNDQKIIVFKVTLDDSDSNISYDWNNRCEYEDEINSVAYYGDIPRNKLTLMSLEEINTIPEKHLRDFKGTLLYDIVGDIFDEEVETNKER